MNCNEWKIEVAIAQTRKAPQVGNRRPKDHRLLERLAPDLERAKKEWRESKWYGRGFIPGNGVESPGFPMGHDDRRRIPESFPRIRMVQVLKMGSDGRLNMEFERRVRKMLGNLNGSGKAQKHLKRERRPARSTIKQSATRETNYALTVIAEMKAEDLAEAAKKAAEEKKWAEEYREEWEREYAAEELRRLMNQNPTPEPQVEEGDLNEPCDDEHCEGACDDLLFEAGERLESSRREAEQALGARHITQEPPEDDHRLTRDLVDW